MKNFLLLFYALYAIFVFSEEVQYLQIGDKLQGSGDWCICSISSNGMVVVIGTTYDRNKVDSGHVQVYAYGESQWNQIGNEIDGKSADDNSGRTVSISSDGMIVAIGAFGNNGSGYKSGHVRVYSYDGSQWNQMGSDINGENANDISGYSLSISSDGKIVAIGAPFNDGDGAGYKSGHVRVYSYDGSQWNQMGADINGERANDISGFSLSISSDGMVVAIGAPFNDGDGAGYKSGHVRVYSYDGSQWTQLGGDINGESANDISGYSLSISSDGKILAVGAPFNDGDKAGYKSGHVRVYSYDGSQWIQMGSDINGENANDYSGWAISMKSDGMTVAIGAPRNDGAGSNSGHVRVYSYDGSQWNQNGSDINGESAFKLFGTSVSISLQGTSTTVAIEQEDGTIRIYTTDCPAGEFVSSDTRSCLVCCPDNEFIFDSDCVEACPDGTTAAGPQDAACVPVSAPLLSQASIKGLPQLLTVYVCIAIAHIILH